MTVELKREIPGVLGKIVATTLERLPVLQSAKPQPSLRDFHAALAGRQAKRAASAASGDGSEGFARAGPVDHLSLIAEIKRRSPSKGALRSDLDPTAVAAIYARHADAISVLTEEAHFGGSLADLSRVRAAVALPILMKDFVISEAQIEAGRTAGADAVLLMASILPPSSIERLLHAARALGMEPIVEVHDDRELDEVLSTSARIIGINNRDLTTLAIDLDTFGRLVARVPDDRLAVCESGIETRADVERVRPLADAVLIGTTLMAAPDLEAKLAELSW